MGKVQTVPVRLTADQVDLLHDLVEEYMFSAPSPAYEQAQALLTVLENASTV